MSKLTKFNDAALTANEQNNAQGAWGFFGGSFAFASASSYSYHQPTYHQPTHHEPVHNIWV